MDPISRLRRRIPHQDGPAGPEGTALTIGQQAEDTLKSAFDELGPKFEERLLRLAQSHATRANNDEFKKVSAEVIQEPPFDNSARLTYAAAATSSLIVGLTRDELERWKQSYAQDPHYRLVLKTLKNEVEGEESAFPQYYLGEDGLIYFEDWNMASRLCVPAALQVELIKNIHDVKTEAAHAGYHRTYNRIASTYYWRWMSRDIKRYVSTCDICQKAKPRRHAPVGLLQPIAIPSQPFEVVMMDFIPELPLSSGKYNNVLVIVDKLTKYGMFIPTTTKISAQDTAKLFFHHVVAHYGLPRQVITDRDTHWTAELWEQLCSLHGIKRALTTAHHPQADGQSEILNQTLEIALRAYVSGACEDWSEHLDGLQLSYNTNTHTATGYAPAYLLRGYHPTTAETFIHAPSSIPRPSPRHVERGGKTVSTSLPSYVKLCIDNSPKSIIEKAQMAKVPYLSAVGNLMYAMICTRLDITYAIEVVSRYLYQILARSTRRQ